MALFTIKTEKKPAIPTDQVLKLRQQGVPDDRIIEMLQKDGFKSHEIFEAMSQADIKGMVAPETIENIPAPENPMAMPAPVPEFISAPHEQKVSDERVQEIAESIIDEKWDLLVENVNKIVDWKDRVEKSIDEIRKKVAELDSKIVKSQADISAEIEKQERAMDNVDAEVKAFTKVLQKVLPDIMVHETKPSAKQAVLPTAGPKKKSRTEEIFGIEDIS
jgi:aminopeptidase N